MIEQKQCSRCNQLKFIYDFHKNKSSMDGYYSLCKECKSAKWKGEYGRIHRKNRYERNKDNIKIRNKKYYENNKGIYMSTLAIIILSCVYTAGLVFTAFLSCLDPEGRAVQNLPKSLIWPYYFVKWLVTDGD